MEEEGKEEIRPAWRAGAFPQTCENTTVPQKLPRLRLPRPGSPARSSCGRRPGPGEGQVWPPRPAESPTPATDPRRAGPVSAPPSQIFILRKTRRKSLSYNRDINHPEKKCVNNKMFPLVRKS